MLLTPQSRAVVIRVSLSRAEEASKESQPVYLSFEQVCFSLGLRPGWAIASLYKHIWDVVAKVDLTVGCYGLVLHELQVLWGQLQLNDVRQKQMSEKIHKCFHVVVYLGLNFFFFTMFASANLEAV